jgi:hypothetical protein
VVPNLFHYADHPYDPIFEKPKNRTLDMEVVVGGENRIFKLSFSEKCRVIY